MVARSFFAQEFQYSPNDMNGATKITTPTELHQTHRPPTLSLLSMQLAQKGIGQRDVSSHHNNTNRKHSNTTSNTNSILNYHPILDKGLIQPIDVRNNVANGNNTNNVGNNPSQQRCNNTLNLKIQINGNKSRSSKSL